MDTVLLPEIAAGSRCHPLCLQRLGVTSPDLAADARCLHYEMILDVTSASFECAGSKS